MIESYLQCSRRVKPTHPMLVNQYETMYKYILSHVRSDPNPPELHITYSSERRSELLTIDGCEYLVHDQYLGQAFNKLNRIQFAIHSNAELSCSVALKYLSQKLLCLGTPIMSALMAITAIQYETQAKEKGDPFDLEPLHEQSRQNMIVAQELFVISHELSHFRFAHEEKKSREEIRKYIEEFLEVKDEKSSTSDYYSETLKSKDCIPEMFADDLGAIIAYKVATENFNISGFDVSQGIILAFKYLRLFSHLDVMARSLSKVSLISEPSKFKLELKKLENEVWEKAGGLRFSQLREHFIRYRMSSTLDPDLDESKKSPLKFMIEDYDEKTEFPIVFGLIDSLYEKLEPEMLQTLANSPAMKGNTTELIDKLTNWA